MIALSVVRASVLLALLFPHAGSRAALPPSTLQVRIGTTWRTWWRSEQSPVRWAGADSTVARGTTWIVLRDGMEHGELRLAGRGEATRLRVVVVRFDPTRFRYLVQWRLTDRRHAAWTADSVPSDAVLAFNLGQFTGAAPWGWLVENGREQHAMGSGPLATVVMVDSTWRARLYAAGDATLPPAAAASVAFQSYPTLLVAHEIPLALRESGHGIDLEHRDSRIALGVQRDGRVVVALTRFDGLNGEIEELPVGLTVPEMAALMGALGCADAVMLDGGISGQLALRAADGHMQVSAGWRKVPIGLVVTPR